MVSKIAMLAVLILALFASSFYSYNSSSYKSALSSTFQSYNTTSNTTTNSTTTINTTTTISQSIFYNLNASSNVIVHNDSSKYNYTIATQSCGSYIYAYGGFYPANYTVNISGAVEPSKECRFQNWTGMGNGSYSGNLVQFNITMGSNVTEVANWYLNSSASAQVTNVTTNTTAGNSTLSTIPPSTTILQSQSQNQSQTSSQNPLTSTINNIIQYFRNLFNSR